MHLGMGEVSPPHFHNYQTPKAALGRQCPKRISFSYNVRSDKAKKKFYPATVTLKEKLLAIVLGSFYQKNIDLTKNIGTGNDIKVQSD